MNRRKFFAGIAAAVTAAIAPASANRIRDDWDFGTSDFTIEGYISQHAWWRPKYGATLREYQIQGINAAKVEARTLASLQAMWKECVAYKSGDTLIIDEQAYEVFKTPQE
jgi:hypothetical protein